MSYLKNCLKYKEDVMSVLVEKSAVEVSLLKLNDNIKILDDLLAEIIIKLKPLLTPDKSSSGVSGMCGVTEDTGLIVMNLDDMNSKVQYMTYRLNNIKGRLIV